MSQAGYLSFTRLGFNKDPGCIIHYADTQRLPVLVMANIWTLS